MERAGTTITLTYSCCQRPEEQIPLSLSVPRRMPPPVICAGFLFKQRSGPSAGNVAMPHYAEPSHRFLSKHFNCSMWERLGGGKKKTSGEGPGLWWESGGGALLGRARAKIEIVSHVYRRTCALGGRRCAENKFLCKCRAARAQPCQ